MAKLVVALREGKPDVEFPDGHVSIAQPGVFIIADKPEGGTIIGMFPIPAVLGIYHPDGPDLVVGIEGRLVGGFSA